MNKLELFEALRNKYNLSKKEAAAVVDLFFLKACLKLLPRETGLKFADYALSMSKNTNPIRAGISKLAKALK